MKRFLSWLVLGICFGLVRALGYLVISLFFYVIHWIGVKSTGVLIFLVLSLGGVGITILLLPFTFGIPFIIRASETISMSRKGTRYKVYSLLWLISAALCLFLAIFGIVEFEWINVYECALAVGILLTYKSYLGDTFD